MRKLLALLAAVAMTAIPAPPASADTPGCVTRAEFHHVAKGMTKERVRRIFDTTGKRQELVTDRGFAAEIRTYHACSAHSLVTVAFDRKGRGKPFRVAAKYAVWF
jgi:hypothetical protein